MKLGVREAKVKKELKCTVTTVSGLKAFVHGNSGALLVISKMKAAAPFLPVSPHLLEYTPLLEGSCQRKSLITLCPCSKLVYSFLLCDSLKPDSSAPHWHLARSDFHHSLWSHLTSFFLCPVSKNCLRTLPRTLQWGT